MKRQFQRVVLHFGSYKTGSSAIQSFLSSARDALPGAARIAYAPEYYHLRVASLVCSDPEAYSGNLFYGLSDRKLVRQLDDKYARNLELWATTLPPCDTLIFSYEGFLDLDEPSLRALLEFCSKWADEVAVVIYVRPPMSYARSVMGQRVKQGLKSWLLDEPPIPLYQDWLEKIVRVFGRKNIIVRLFSVGALKEGDVVKDFLDVVGVDVNLLSDWPIDRVNEGVSQNGLRFGETLIDWLDKAGLQHHQGRFFELYGKHLSLIPGPQIRLTEAQADEVALASLRHVEYLKQQFGILLDADEEDLTGEQSEINSFELLDATAKVLGRVVTGGREVRADFSVEEFLLLSIETNCYSEIERGRLVFFNVGFSLSQLVKDLEVGIHIFDSDGRWVFGTNTTLLGQSPSAAPCGTHYARFGLMADLPLGEYTVGFGFADSSVTPVREIAWYNALITFRVGDSRSTRSVGYSPLLVEIDRSCVSSRVVEQIRDTTGVMVCDSIPGELVAGRTAEFSVEIANNSAQDWVGTYHSPINLSYRWFDGSGGLEVSDGLRTKIPHFAIAAGARFITTIAVVAPARPGTFLLVAMPVVEGKFWFDARGFTPLSLTIKIVTKESLGSS